MYSLDESQPIVQKDSRHTTCETVVLQDESHLLTKTQIETQSEAVQIDLPKLCVRECLLVRTTTHSRLNLFSFSQETESTDEPIILSISRSGAFFRLSCVV